MKAAAQDPGIEAARKVLLMRATRQARRAARARIGSGERRKCLSEARFLGHCVREIDSDEKLREHLCEVGVTGAGWQALADAVARFVRQRERRKVPHA